MAHPTDVYVGKRLRHFRWLKGATQTDLAEAIDVKFQQVQKYETGFNRISASRLLEAAKFLGRPVSDFFPGEDEADEPAINPAQARLIMASNKMTEAQFDAFLNIGEAMVEGQ